MPVPNCGPGIPQGPGYNRCKARTAHPPIAREGYIMPQPPSDSYGKMILLMVAASLLWLFATRFDAITRSMMNFASRYAPDL